MNVLILSVKNNQRKKYMVTEYHKKQRSVFLETPVLLADPKPVLERTL